MAHTNPPTENPDRTHGRRDFIKKTAAAATAFMVVPRQVLGGVGSTPPSEKLNIASIGAGGQAAEISGGALRRTS